ncbi:MAG TPA: DUF4279 domain-containing protein [Phycisphaerales bacterium]|nr:DUF4279 domain-containing protein [Phycisphaerales bacterium]
MSKPTVQAEFVLTSVGRDVTPRCIADRIALVPESTWTIGDAVRPGGITRKNTGWRFVLPSEAAYDMDLHLRQLLDLIEPHKTHIAEAVEQLKLTILISITVYMRDETPAAWFSAATLRRVVELGADLDIDMYLLPPVA